jgi:hypothetical protein
MDPNANLKELLRIANQVVSEDDHDEGISHDVSARMAELVISLDGWINRGGFLPERWIQK